MTTVWVLRWHDGYEFESVVAIFSDEYKALLAEEEAKANGYDDFSAEGQGSYWSIFGMELDPQIPEPKEDIYGPWDVYRNAEGDPVTITWEQVHAIWHAYRVWIEVCVKEGALEQLDMRNPANWEKSRLLGRMLIEGRRPLADKPPLIIGEPAYHLVEGNV